MRLGGGVICHGDRGFHHVCGVTRLFTGDSVTIVVLNSGKANGRRVTRGVRLRDGETSGPFRMMSYNALSTRLTISTLFKRRGKTFADTSTTEGNCFRLTTKNALFLSRVNGLPGSMRTVLLHILRSGDCQPLKTAGSGITSIHVVTTAGRGLRRTIQRKQFEDSLCCQLRRTIVRVPQLQSYGRSVVPLTGFFLGLCSERASGRVGYVDGRTREALMDRA